LPPEPANDLLRKAAQEITRLGWNPNGSFTRVLTEAVAQVTTPVSQVPCRHLSTSLSGCTGQPPPDSQPSLEPDCVHLPTAATGRATEGDATDVVARAGQIADLRSDGASDGTRGADEGHLDAAAGVRWESTPLSGRAHQGSPRFG
jgi:hypothetical protein